MTTGVREPNPEKARDNSQPAHPDRRTGTDAFERNGRPSGSPVALERRLMRYLLEKLGSPPIKIQFWDGTEVAASKSSETIGALKIRNRQTLWRLAIDPAFQIGESYANGTLEVEGDLLRLLEAVHRTQQSPGGVQLDTGTLASRFRRRIHNIPERSRENIHQHYDIGNDFYRLWLDAEMAYTCAYFKNRNVSLEQAQIDKFDHVCRKLQLEPGQTVVEAGCGWGGFALHMARECGVVVRAYNISQEQVAFARRRAREAGLEDRVEFVLDDWRNISGRYDAFVSVGMLEHIGVKNYRLLGDVIQRSLVPRGRGLIHSIGTNQPRPMNVWIERRIFPGAQPPSLGQMMDIFEGNDFSIQDVENLRLHYALTLKHWWERFEQSADRVLEMFDERFVRMWRLYLASSTSAFESGWLQLFQVSFTHGSNNNLACTREHLYADQRPETFPPL